MKRYAKKRCILGLRINVLKLAPINFANGRIGTDISARLVIDADLLSFSVPLVMFKEMEANVPGSFLEKPAWHKVAVRISNNE